MNRHIHATRPHIIDTPSQNGALALHFRPLHIGLVIASLVLLLYYVVQANLIAAETWRLRDVRDQLGALSGKRDALVAEEARLDDRTVLQALALTQGMVPAGTVSYLIQPANVATAR